MGNQNLLFHIDVRHYDANGSYKETRSDLHNKAFTISQLIENTNQLNLNYNIAISIINDYTDIDCVYEICTLFSTFVDRKNFRGFIYKYVNYVPSFEEISAAPIKTEVYVRALKADVALKIKDILNQHYSKVIINKWNKHIVALELCEQLILHLSKR